MRFWLWLRLIGINKVRSDFRDHLLFRWFFWRLRPSFKEADPPSWRIERAVAVVERWVDVVEEIPN
jgi:hypothetical protein